MKELLGQDKSEFNVIFVHSALDDVGLSPAEFRIYAHLARRANQGRAWPGIDSIARVCGMSSRSVVRDIDALEKRQMIHVRRTPGKQNVYILTKHSEWLIPTLPTDHFPSVTGDKNDTTPVTPGKRKVIQEGNPNPAGLFGDVITNQADTIGNLFKRRKSTPWSEKEVRAWKKLTKKAPLDADSLIMIERYYAEARRKSDNYCRRDLLTFLNNYPGEVDRAVSWCEKHPLPGARKIKVPVQLPDIVYPPDDPEAEKKFLADFERVHHRLPYGYSRNGGEIVKSPGRTESLP